MGYKKNIEINTDNNFLNRLDIPINRDTRIVFNGSNINYGINNVDCTITPISIADSSHLTLDMGMSSFKNEIEKQNFSINANITEILFKSNFVIHILKGGIINFDADINGFVGIIDHNVDSSVQYPAKKNNQIIVGSQMLSNNDLTFNSKTCPFTIKFIPSSVVLKLDIVKKIKIHLIAEKVLANINYTDTKIHKSNTIECKYNDLPLLENSADADFMRDYLVCKQHNLLLPNEIMAIIGFFVNGEIKISNKINENVGISVESYNSIWCMGSTHIDLFET